MEVKLLRHTESPVKLITDAASICYGKDEATNIEKLLQHLLEKGHHSVFEHVYFTWRIDGISRACLGQLTRHRMASFTVRSQRYCNEDDQDFVIPDDIRRDDVNFMIWLEAKAEIKHAYQQLIKRGVKKEDARFILPQATETDLYFSCNLRELMHIAKLRISKQAQWEIKELTQQMIIKVLDIMPELYTLFLPIEKEDKNE